MASGPSLVIGPWSRGMGNHPKSIQTPNLKSAVKHYKILIKLMCEKSTTQKLQKIKATSGMPTAGWSGATFEVRLVGGKG